MSRDEPLSGLISPKRRSLNTCKHERSRKKEELNDVNIIIIYYVFLKNKYKSYKIIIDIFVHHLYGHPLIFDK